MQEERRGPIVKGKRTSVRRNEILDVPSAWSHQRLRADFHSGYSGRSANSKGAFYHYYNSKQALLEALSNRMMAQAEEIMTPI